MARLGLGHTVSKAHLLTTSHKKEKNPTNIIQQIKPKCKCIVLNSPFWVNMSMGFRLDSVRLKMANENLPFSHISVKKNWRAEKMNTEDIYTPFKAVSENSCVGEGMGWTATISILQKEQGNRDSGTNFQDIFLRLKIGLTLGLSWEKSEQMKSSYINCSQEHASGHGTRLRDTDWLANTASLFQLRIFLQLTL